jgi:ATP-binding cassette subfamily B protein
MLADRVALLAHGRIAALGTHSELMATVPAYRDLLTSRTDDPTTTKSRSTPEGVTR